MKVITYNCLLFLLISSCTAPHLSTSSERYVGIDTFITMHEVILYSVILAEKFDGKKENALEAFKKFKSNREEFINDYSKVESADESSKLDDIFDNIIVISYNHQWVLNLIGNETEELVNRFDIEASGDCRLLVFYEYNSNPSTVREDDNFILCFDLNEARLENLKFLT